LKNKKTTPLWAHKVCCMDERRNTHRGTGDYCQSLAVTYTPSVTINRSEKIELTMSQEEQPLVSIGLPVFNGEDFLEKALHSILNQTYRNIEVIVCDNASTDRTSSIVAAYHKSDDRINYHRHDVNLGAAGNYNRTFELSKGKYFKWAAHDDVLHENYIEQCVQTLESDSSTSLVQSLVGQIDEDGIVTTHEYTGIDDAIAEDTSNCTQYRILMQKRGAWVRIFGLIRSDILKNTPLIDKYIGSDLTLLGELGLNGKVKDLDTVLFWRREHNRTSTRGKFKARRKRLVWFDSKKNSNSLSLPEWKLTWEMFRSITRQNLPLTSKMYCCRVIVGRMWIKKKLLVQDIFYSTADLLKLLKFKNQPESKPT